MLRIITFPAQRPFSCFILERNTIFKNTLRGSCLHRLGFGSDLASTGDFFFFPFGERKLQPFPRKTFMCLFTDDLFRLSPFLNNGSSNKQLWSIKDALLVDLILLLFLWMCHPFFFIISFILHCSFLCLKKTACNYNLCHVCFCRS